MYPPACPITLHLLLLLCIGFVPILLISAWRQCTRILLLSLSHQHCPLFFPISTFFKKSLFSQHLKQTKFFLCSYSYCPITLLPFPDKLLKSLSLVPLFSSPLFDLFLPSFHIHPTKNAFLMTSHDLHLSSSQPVSSISQSWTHLSFYTLFSLARLHAHLVYLLQH
jgi:hypothetical protein